MALTLTTLALSPAPAAVAESAARLPAVCTPAAGALQRADSAVSRALQREHADPFRDLPAAAREKAQQRAAFVGEVERRVAETGCPQAAAVLFVAAARAAAFPALAACAHGGGSALTWNNYRAWRRRLGTERGGRVALGNWRALVDRYSRGERGRRGAEEWWQFFYRLRLTQNSLSLAQAYDQAAAWWRRAGMPANGIPERHHVAYWHRTYGDRLAELLSTRGETWFQNHVQGYIARDWSGIRPGEIWVGDHRLSDYLIQAPDENGIVTAQRVWQTAWRDAKSGHWVSWLIYPGGESPNAAAIIQTLILGIQACGNVPPLAIYIDNGKDFCAGGFSQPVAVGGAEYSICRSLGIEIIQAIAYNPRAKLVERSFRDVAGRFDRLLPAYIGNCPAKRPEKAWAMARANVSALLTLEQAGCLFEAELARQEEATTASLVQGGVPTAELWAGRRALRPALADAELHLLSLRPTGELRQIGRGIDGPSVRWADWTYSGPELREYARQHWGEPVHVLVDVFAGEEERAGKSVPTHVYTAAPDGRIIGRCVAGGTMAAWVRSDEEREALSEAMADKRRLLPETKRAVRELTGTDRAAAAPLQAIADWAQNRRALPRPAKQLADSAESPHQSPGAHAGHAPPAHESTSSAESAASDPALVAELERILGGDHGTGHGDGNPAAADAGDLALLRTIEEMGNHERQQ